MNEDVRVLFRELAGHPTAYREAHYARHEVPVHVRDELECLLGFDQTSGASLGGVVEAAAERFLLSGGPAAENGRCGPYRLIRPLGNGGMGAVYLAERDDGEIEQRVAIKFLHAGANLPSLRERFLRERRIQASLNHPGAARLLDAGHSNNHPYLVMEYVEGTHIDEFVSRLDPRGILTLFLQVAEAVSYAHRNLIIHRDLKPSNILVDAAGQPKLLDFGIAKILDSPEQTRTVERALTPEYASPEQLRGGPQATATDIYSLGAVLYRLLTGRSPRAPAPPTGHDIPRDLAAILAKAMRIEPRERYASVDLFIADLRAYLEHRPVQARRGNALYLARKFVRRRWLPVAAGILAFLGIAGGAMVADRERAIAQRRFQQVRQLSKRLLDLDAGIRNLPGSTKARNLIVSAATEYLEGLEAEARRTRWGVPPGQDMDLALEIGTAYLQVARVRGVPANPNLGQFAEAARSLQKADALIEAVLRVPSFPQRKSALLTSAGIAHDAMILAQSENHTGDCLVFGRKADSRLEAMLAMPGVTPDDVSTAARLYANLALAHSNIHYLDDAARYARRSVEISLRSKDERLLSKSLGILSNTARFAGDLDGALQAIRQSRAIAEKFADPENTDSILQLCGALWREGLILGELRNVGFGRPREAEPLLRRAFDIAENLARRDPRDYASRSYVSMAGRELGDILRDRDPARALAVYDHTLSRLREVGASSKARREQVWLLTGSSYALRRLHRPGESVRRIETALAILRTLHAYPATCVELGDETDYALRALADHYADTGDTAGAIRTYEELREKVNASHPRPLTDLRHANNLSLLYGDLGNLYARAGRLAEASVLRQKRLDLWQYWDGKLPDNVFIRRRLSIARMP